jgi:hypothetical protein
VVARWAHSPATLVRFQAPSLRNKMGQLDSIEINELFFTGLLCALVPAYAAEEIESTIENVKAYVYSAARVS